MAYEQPTSDRNLIGLSQHRPALIGRRQALCTFAGIATAVAGVGLLGVGTAHAESTTTGAEPQQGETVTAEEVVRNAEAERELALVEALVPRDLDVGKWSIEQVHPVRFGAIAVVMRTPEGDAFQVDVLRRDRSVAGVAETEQLSVFVANRGDGSKVTRSGRRAAPRCSRITSAGPSAAARRSRS